MDKWNDIHQKLQAENKAGLIELLRELTAVSPSAYQFLQARHLHLQDIALRVRPYQERITAEFESKDPWSDFLQNGNLSEPDFEQIMQAIKEYRAATREEPEGTAELCVYATETAVGFMLSMSIHDADFFDDVAELAWQCVSHFNNFPTLYPLYVDRLHAIAAKLSEHQWEGLTIPFYQLDADMDNYSEELL